ncbi:MAG: hypothetical protein SFY69_04580 [Planctomycetota bacterium]|nr:hypothetical protein [Planctomycetota bacterium]
MARSSKAPADVTRFAWRDFLSHVTGACVLLICLALLCGVLLGIRPLEARAASLTRSPRPTITIHWPPLPGGAGTWLPRDEQERLAQLASDAAGADENPYAPDTLERISRALASTGWFEGYPSVRRGSPGSIGVRGSWRIPAAVVRSQGTDFLLSWDAMPLPPAYDAGASTLPVIHSPAKGPPRAPSGERIFTSPWQGSDVGAALELLGAVGGKPWSAQVAGVDLSRYTTEEVLMLVTRSGNRIVWGGRPSAPRSGEVSTRQKLVHLAQLHHDFKQIDAGYPLIYINTGRLQFDTSATAAAESAVNPAPVSAVPAVPPAPRSVVPPR